MRITKKDIERLLSVLENGTNADVDLQLESMIEPNGRKILQEVECLLVDIKNDQSEALIDMQGELATTAAFKCQDAIEQLEYIVNEGTKAALSTLELTEQIQGKLSQLDLPSEADKSVLSDVNSLLIDVMVSQSYQDLSAQVVMKLTSFVRKLEVNLAQIVDLNRAVGHKDDLGPALFRSVDDVEGQSVVDSIMSETPRGA